MAESEAPARAGLPVWEVAALVHAVADALAARFGAVAVRGELSGFSRAASGHCYFTLKDAGESAALRCAMFRRAASLIDFAPEEGHLVELRGRLAVYEPRGELQFIVESMRRAGAGALYERFLRLKALLQAEGLFETARKRPIPPRPRGIGIVTSLAAAALHDVLTALQRRSPHVRIVVYPSPVQGTEAPAALANAIALAGTRAEVDTLIVCRGGGSLEDLWAFNEAVVVRAIAACPLPVIAGIGHETDVTLADLAADLRAPTPTAAAELASVAREDMLAEQQQLAARASRALRRRLDSDAQRVDRMSLRLARPAQALAPHRERLALLTQRRQGAMVRLLERHHLRHSLLAPRLQQAVRQAQARERQRIDLLAARLRALDPRQVLGRGYAWLTDVAGQPLSSVTQLHAGQMFTATVADGQALAEVRSITAAMPPA
jgi:exodeoxyribonuclease VII large subunit